MRPDDRCPVCDAGGAVPRFSRNGIAIARCPSCGLTFAPHEPAPAAVRSLYDEAYFIGGGAGYDDYIRDEAVHRRQARRYLRRLAAFGIAVGFLFDVGCAAGFFLDEARRAGWRTRGCDVSGYAAQHAREALGLDVEAAPFLEADVGDEPFDLVTLFNVFEHLTQPRAVVAKLERMVRPGGAVAIETWNANSVVARALGSRWHQYDPPRVLYYYSRRTLRRLFTPADWDLASFRRSAKWISLRRGLEILAHRRPGPVARLLGRFGNAAWLERQVPYAAGDLVFTIFRRRA